MKLNCEEKIRIFLIKINKIKLYQSRQNDICCVTNLIKFVIWQI